MESDSGGGGGGAGRIRINTADASEAFAGMVFPPLASSVTTAGTIATTCAGP